MEHVTIEFRTSSSPLDRRSTATIAGITILATSMSVWGGRVFSTALGSVAGTALLVVVLVAGYTYYRSSRQRNTSTAPDYTLTVDDTLR